MFIDFETYLMLNSIPEKCSILLDNGNFCHKPAIYLNKDMCVEHISKIRNKEYKTTKDNLRIKLKNMNKKTLIFYISEAIFTLSEPLKQPKVSVKAITNFIIANKHYNPNNKLLKKRLEEMVRDKYLLKIKLSYRLSLMYKNVLKDFINIK